MQAEVPAFRALTCGFLLAESLVGSPLGANAVGAARRGSGEGDNVRFPCEEPIGDRDSDGAVR